MRFAARPDLVNCRGVTVDEIGVPAEIDAGALVVEPARSVVSGARWIERLLPPARRARPKARWPRAGVLRVPRGRRPRAAAQLRRATGPRSYPGRSRSTKAPRRRERSLRSRSTSSHETGDFSFACTGRGLRTRDRVARARRRRPRRVLVALGTPHSAVGRTLWRRSAFGGTSGFLRQSACAEARVSRQSTRGRARATLRETLSRKRRIVERDG